VTGVGRGTQPRRAIWQVPTVALVMAGWILFRSPSLGYAAGFVRSLFRIGQPVPLTVSLAAEPIALVVLAVGCASVLIPAAWVTGVRLENSALRLVRPLRWAMVAVVLPACLVAVMAGNFSPFLYFQF
jgi:alginate O-acetyltransferase complex protein AlgI